MASDEDIVFMGRDGNGCEEFIRAIHKAAYTAGRIRDDAWMADLASACFSGRALRYYQSLEPGVQCNWRLLSRALFAKYPWPDDDEDELQSGGSRMLQASTEGLSPPLETRTGRIKVIGVDSSDYGYLADGSTLGAGGSATEALSLCYVPAKGPFELEIKRPDGQNQLLGMHWNSQAPSVAIGSDNFARLAAFNYEGSLRSSTVGWSGLGHTRIWRVLPDNTICPHMEGDGSFKPLQFFAIRGSEAQRHSIDIAADAGVFTFKHGPDGWKLVKLLFEPLS